jgi:hypothetical protein
VSIDEHDALLVAVRDAVRAPSVFNTQPWCWVVDGSALELYADPARKLVVVDPNGTLMLLSCGAALHHARVSLSARGWRVEVERLVAGQNGSALARLRIVGRDDPDPAAVALREAIKRRRTDRRPYGDEPVPVGALADLAAAAEAEGTGLHRVRLDQMSMLAVAAAAAATEELASPAYRIELVQWTNRPEWAGDGVPPQTAVRRAPRRVPVREFALFPEEGMRVAQSGDLGSAFLVLHGPGEQPLDWLRAGEALSAVLLTAVGHELAAAPFTDVLEVEHPRDLVRGLLPGASNPYVVVRCGYPPTGGDLPAVPRRDVAEVLRDEPDRVAG